MGNCDADAIETLIRLSKGDMRKAITTLHSAHRLSMGDAISSQALVDLSGEVPDERVTAFWNVCQGDSFEALEGAVEGLSRDGYAAHATVRQLLEKVATDAGITDLMKAKIAIKIAEVDKKLIDGASDKLQLLSVASF